MNGIRFRAIVIGILAGAAMGSGASHARPVRDLTLKDSGTTARMKKGEVLTLRLEMRAGTGFSWRIAKYDPAILKLLGDKIVTPPNTEGHMEIQLLRFRALRPGRSALELHYRRPWEKGRPDERKFAVTVLVR